jgi:hypothetical protein
MNEYVVTAVKHSRQETARAGGLSAGDASASVQLAKRHRCKVDDLNALDLVLGVRLVGGIL